MASEQPEDSSPEIRALRQCTPDLVKAIRAADLLEIASQLYSKGLVELDIVESCELQITSSQKSIKIVCAVIKTVSASPHFFEPLVSILSESGNAALMSVGENLKQIYDSIKELLTEKPCHSHSFHTHPHHPPITPHPHHPPITPHPHHPPITPSQLQSPICRYANHLRAVYKRFELSNPACYKWMCSPGEKFKFINLAVISKEKLNEGEAEKIKKETIHGHIDIILKKKAPIAIENILQVERKQSLSCVLIEGAPGVGKSTLACEVCQRWGRGELFQEYSIMLLVTLRDERMHRATCVVDLFYHSNKKLQEEVVEEIGESNGKGTLILLEGLDELPRQLLTGYSIFTDLLSGAIFPEATVLVTSRPSATDKLWQKWWQKISRHIEILGFTEDNIDEYTKNVLSDHQLLDFNNYLSIHPHIKSMMYIPLHCAVAMAVYLLCQQSADRSPPKTLTGLYKCLAQTILMQYLQDHPDYKDNKCQLDSFSDLPSPVYSHFKKLCCLAFDGVDKQQLVYRNLPQSLDTHQQFEHLGFMDAVPEQFLQSAIYSYNFLHLSVQEYLAAYHVSLMSHLEQEQLLQTVKYGDHRFNMVRFLAGITQLKHLNKELVKKVIGIEEYYLGHKKNMSGYALEFLYECQDMSILDSTECYYSEIQSFDSVHRLTALGYCIAMSNTKWQVTFLGRDNSGTEVLCHNLNENTQPTYSIENIEYRACTPDFTHQVLRHLPEYALEHIKKISVQHDDMLPLPPCLPEILPRMKKLNELTLKNVLSTSLMELIPALSRVTTLRNILFSDRGYNFVMHFLLEDLSTGTIRSMHYTSEFLDQLLPALPQQSLTDIKSLTITYSKCKHDGSFQPLPPCLPQFIPRMKTLKTLTLKNVLETSLTQLIPALSSVPTLRNLILPKLSSDGITHLCQWLPTCHLENLTLHEPIEAPSLTDPPNAKYESTIPEMTMTFSGNCIETIVYQDCTSEFIEQILSQIPQHSLVHVKELKIHNKYIRKQTENIPISFQEYPDNLFTDTAQFLSQFRRNCMAVELLKRKLSRGLSGDPQPLPPCLPELIPRMERLNILVLENVLHTLLMELIPTLSRVSKLRLFSDGEHGFEIKLNFPAEDHCSGTIESRNVTPEFLDQLLPALPQQSIACVKSLTISCRAQPLPSCLLELVPNMENLNSLTFTTVLDTTLTALISLLSTVSSKRSLTLFITLCTSESQSFFLDEITFTYWRNPKDACTCTCTLPEAIEQILQYLPRQHISQIETLEVDYSKTKPQPHCLPELIPKMEKLNKVILQNVLYSSLTELIPVLSRVPTLRVLTVLQGTPYCKSPIVLLTQLHQQNRMSTIIIKEVYNINLP